jgi:predicted AAA+ superfamily ATPase
MIKRIITRELVESAKEYPIVTIFGPRQSGKTTLAQMTFPKKAYYSLEDPDIRLQIKADPRGFLNNNPNGCILDEIQRFPQLLSYIQTIVDKKSKTGMYILTGSHQPQLHEAVSQSLAGRTAILSLLPFSYKEVKRYHRGQNAFELIFEGFFPRLHEKQLDVNRFFNSYLQTYVERDIRAILNLKDIDRFEKFLVLLAGRIGSIVNYASLSNDVGVSATTIKSWIGVLKSSFILFELPPFFENIRKRIVKSPKIYFTDTGLASFLLGIKSKEQVERDPLRGALYENMIIIELLKTFYNDGQKPNLFFYRDSHGNEVDCIIRHNRKLIPIEIKSGSTFTKDFLKGIKLFQKVAGEKIYSPTILYNGETTFTINGVNVLNLLKKNLNLDF